MTSTVSFTPLTPAHLYRTIFQNLLCLTRDTMIGYFICYNSCVMLLKLTFNYVFSKLFNPNNKHEMVVAVVACGERLQETLIMLKSCLMFSSKSPLRFIVIADEGLRKEFAEKLSEWQQILNGSFRYEILGLEFPEKNKEEWKKLFKPCASQRLFLPVIINCYYLVLKIVTVNIIFKQVKCFLPNIHRNF